MLNVGGGEILVVLIIALLVLGPTRLPGAARQVGRALAEFRRISSGVERDIRDALDTDEIRESVATFREVTSLGSSVKSEFASAASSLVGSRSNAPALLGQPNGTAVSPQDGLFADDQAISVGGASIPSPAGRFFDVLADDKPNRAAQSETSTQQ